MSLIYNIACQFWRYHALFDVECDVIAAIITKIIVPWFTTYWTFRRNTTPPSSDSKPNRACDTLMLFFLDLRLDHEDGGNMFCRIVALFINVTNQKTLHIIFWFNGSIGTGITNYVLKIVISSLLIFEVLHRVRVVDVEFASEVLPTKYWF
jgi:hypothetical protein